MLTSSLTPGTKQAVDAGQPKSISHSHFDPNQQIIGTFRFGEITPHFAFELLDNDKDIVMRCLHNLRTLPMKSPLMNDSKMHKAYFNVPMQAILPFNYEKWRTIPVSGDDCPADAGTTVTNFESKVHTCILNWITNHASQGTALSDAYNLFSYLALITLLCSEGNLLHSLGIRNFKDFQFYYNGTNMSADDVVEGIFSTILSNYSADAVLFTWNGFNVLNTTLLLDDDINSVTPSISLRTFWMRFLNQPTNSFTGTLAIDTADIWSWFDAINNAPIAPSVASGNYEIPVDLRRVHAYNLVCSHFFSNDHIDYIYTAELYRQNQYSLIKLCGFDSGMRFTMNGVPYEYDALSGHAVSLMLLNTLPSNDDYVIAYLANMFNFNRSLRFMDYFTGSRKQPLAIGSNNVPVVGGNVSVLDITKSIQFQRLRNFANRIGPRFDSFFSGIFGKTPAYDYHNPFWIADTEDELFVSEVENTSTDQQNNSGFITSSVKSRNENYAFNFDSDRDSVLIGVTYFDIVRYYPFGIPKIFQHIDKFDDFLPDLQFIGDQDILCSELGSFLNAGQPFSYTTRNQEYKVSVPYCFGGIRQALRTWSYTFPNTQYLSAVSPDFIRSIQTELDKFYSQLSGYSLRNYFHFIIKSTNLISISRPMTKNPQIL